MPEQKVEQVPVGQPVGTEAKPEKRVETPSTHEKVQESDATATAAAKAALDDQADKSQPVVGDSVVLAKVENILAKDMDNVFLSMDAATQQKFKVKGEEVAKEIASLLKKAGVRAKDVINLIISWLRIIPKINRYYLEQEAKIKADEILKMHQPK